MSAILSRPQCINATGPSACHLRVPHRCKISHSGIILLVDVSNIHPTTSDTLNITWMRCISTASVPGCTRFIPASIHVTGRLHHNAKCTLRKPKIFICIMFTLIYIIQLIYLLHYKKHMCNSRMSRVCRDEETAADQTIINQARSLKNITICSSTDILGFTVCWHAKSLKLFWEKGGRGWLWNSATWNVIAPIQT